MHDFIEQAILLNDFCSKKTNKIDEKNDDFKNKRNQFISTIERKNKRYSSFTNVELTKYAHLYFRDIIHIS